MLLSLQSIGKVWRMLMCLPFLAMAAIGIAGAMGDNDGAGPAAAAAGPQGSASSPGERDFASQIADGYNGGRPKIDASQLAGSTANAGDFAEGRDAQVEAGQFGTEMRGGDFSGDYGGE